LPKVGFSNKRGNDKYHDFACRKRKKKGKFRCQSSLLVLNAVKTLKNHVLGEVIALDSRLKRKSRLFVHPWRSLLSLCLLPALMNVLPPLYSCVATGQGSVEGVEHARTPFVRVPGCLLLGAYHSFFPWHRITGAT
jgi:hypothetical protein